MQLAGDVALEAAPDLGFVLALGDPAGDVGRGLRAAARPGLDDGVDGLVQRAVAAAIETVSGVLASIGLIPPRAA
ncbi:MAG: hypothetical protein QOE59_5079 [Actinomycetota bacterium]|nr:hypothetical protein [Actinomycetota bacterium]